MRADIGVPVDLQSLRPIQRKLLKYFTIQVYQTTDYRKPIDLR